MINYTLKHLHQDIKRLLIQGGHRMNWTPHYYQKLKDYIFADMARLNKLCNQNGKTSFAVCFNDFLITDHKGHKKFNHAKFNQLCHTNFGSGYQTLLQKMHLSNPAQKFQSFKKGQGGYCFTSPDFQNTIIVYGISGFNLIEAMTTPYHEYGHALDFQYGLLEKTNAYQNYLLNTPSDNQSQHLAKQYLQEWTMLQESLADCFAYSCLALKEPEYPEIYQRGIYNMAVKFRNVVENKHSPLYCGYASTRTLLNKIQQDYHNQNMKKYYLKDGSINFLSLAQTCANIVKKQGYNHDNYQTLISYPLQKSPDKINLRPEQYNQWHYDYLEALMAIRQNRIADPFYRLLYGIGQEIISNPDKQSVLTLLDKYDIPAFHNCFNEYRNIILRQESSRNPQNITKLLKQKSRK